MHHGGCDCAASTVPFWLVWSGSGPTSLAGWFGPVLARPRSFGPGGKAGDGFALVSDGVPHLLALEIAEGGRAAED